MGDRTAILRLAGAMLLAHGGRITVVPTERTMPVDASLTEDELQAIAKSEEATRAILGRMYMEEHPGILIDPRPVSKPPRGLTSQTYNVEPKEPEAETRQMRRARERAEERARTRPGPTKRKGRYGNG